MSLLVKLTKEEKLEKINAEIKKKTLRLYRITQMIKDTDFEKKKAEAKRKWNNENRERTVYHSTKWNKNNREKRNETNRKRHAKVKDKKNAKLREKRRLKNET